MDPDPRASQEDTRRWLDAWQAADARLVEERWERLRALDDESSWAEAEGLAALWESNWVGDAGGELILHQRVFARARHRGRHSG
jgi:hypothetical protein